MASTAARRLQELQGEPGNKTCVDCAQWNPQWANVSYRVFMCLECSGKHRGLGVHINFVRSVTMDSWTEAQLRKMEAEGNDRLNAFLTARGVPKETPHVATSPSTTPTPPPPTATASPRSPRAGRGPTRPLLRKRSDLAHLRLPGSRPFPPPVWAAAEEGMTGTTTSGRT